MIYGAPKGGTAKHVLILFWQNYINEYPIVFIGDSPTELSIDAEAFWNVGLSCAEPSGWGVRPHARSEQRCVRGIHHKYFIVCGGHVSYWK